MIQKNAIYALIFCFPFIVNGQAPHTITLIDQQTKESVAWVQVVVSDLNASSQTVLISDANGKVVCPNSTPLLVQTHHLGYLQHKDTIWQHSKEIALIPAVTNLNELVITGSALPERAEEAVYKVKTIAVQDFQQQGVIDVKEALQTQMNIQFNRDNATGTSGITMQGLSGQYVKILIDGIPVEGKGGVSNEVDLSQLNLQQFERIEIVEGPMAVLYGADALAGVVNLISKKPQKEKVDLEVSLYTGTVGKEYALFNQGEHILSTSLQIPLKEKWHFGMQLRASKFGGWQGEVDSRSHLWYPKNNLNFTPYVAFNSGTTKIQYRLGISKQKLENLGEPVDLNPLKDPYAIDEEYLDNRWMHQLKANYTLGKLQSETSAAITVFNRYTNEFVTNLATKSTLPTSNAKQDTLLLTTFWMRQNFNGIAEGHWGSLNGGLEAKQEITKGTSLSDGTKNIQQAAVFAMATVKIKEELKINTGLRYQYSNQFKSTPTASVNLLHHLSPYWQWRLSYGRGFRTPSARELYHEFIDANHHILGNPDLEPEYSHSLNAGLQKAWSKHPLSMGLSFYYNVFDNRITYYTSGNNAPTSYINVLRYKTLGGNYDFNFQWNSLKVALGVGGQGEYQQLSQTHGEAVPEFIFTPQIKTRVTYNCKPIQLKVMLSHQYYGTAQNYQQSINEQGESSIELTQMDAYNWIDLSFHKAFNRYVSSSFGVKNALNLTQINNNYSTNVHGGSNGQSSIGYGRSYFLQLNFQLNKP